MMSELFSIARIVVGTAILGLAAVSDMRTRTVGNRYWIVMGTAGILILGIEILMSAVDSSGGYEYWHMSGLVPGAVLFYDIFWDREPLYEDRLNLTALTAFVFAFLGALVCVLKAGAGQETIQLLMIPLMIGVGYVFFYTGLLHGGADAKAFMAVAVLVPVYPVFESILPLIAYPEVMEEGISLIFPFAFLMLMNAALISALVLPFFMFLRNLARRDFGFPEMLLGYRMDLDEVTKKFVWPMEAVRDGELVLLMFPKRNMDVRKELERLRERGMERIWVTPKLPFIIPIFLGFVFSFLVGNVMVLLFNTF